MHDHCMFCEGKTFEILSFSFFFSLFAHCTDGSVGGDRRRLLIKLPWDRLLWTNGNFVRYGDDEEMEIGELAGLF